MSNDLILKGNNGLGLVGIGDAKLCKGKARLG